MKIIGLTGKAGAGKDTVYQIIVEQHKAVGGYSFATPVYNMLNEAFVLPITTAKVGRRYRKVLDKNAIVEGTGKTLRYLLQTLGTEWGRNTVNKQIWVNCANNDFESYARNHPDCKYFVFTDVRFDNEAEYVKSLGGKIVRIHNKKESAEGHESEKGVDDKHIDHLLGNNGTKKELKENVIKVLDTLWK